METVEELHSYHRDDLFLAFDARAAYGLLADNGQYFYATYDSPAQSYLYDLSQDPEGEHDILTNTLKKHFDQQFISHLMRSLISTDTSRESGRYWPQGTSCTSAVISLPSNGTCNWQYAVILCII